MLEAKADLWSYIGNAGHICITTNGDVNRAGLAVMGRGCALEAATRWPEVRKTLAWRIEEYGNTPHLLGVIRLPNEHNADFVPNGSYKTVALDRCFGYASMLWSFPVKHHWSDKADIELIQQSAKRLDKILAFFGDRGSVVLPRPGCGNGHLDWKDVKPVLDWLDDRYTVVTK